MAAPESCDEDAISKHLHDVFREVSRGPFTGRSLVHKYIN